MTFTVLAVDRGAGVLGVATASFSLAVGSSVPAVDPAVGAVASQAWTNRRLRHTMLQILGQGGSPERAVAAVPEVDAGAERRQVGAVDLSGRTAGHTGADCTPWAGARSGTGYLLLGNCLAGPQVLTAMEKSFLDHDPHSRPGDALDLAGRLLTALRAGQDAGGDARGDQSAAVLVGRAQPAQLSPPLLDVDLRVDDAREPLTELARLLALRERLPPSPE